MDKMELINMVRCLRGSSDPGKATDGARIHVYYNTIPGNTPSDKAKEEAKRAEVLGLEKQRYTGVVSKVFESKGKDLCLCMRVELERASEDGKPCFRTFNVTRGDIVTIAVLKA